MKFASLVLASCVFSLSGSPAAFADTSGNIVAESLGYTDIQLRDTSQSLIADFHTPAPIVDRLNDERIVDWSVMTADPANLTRFAFSSSESADIFILSDADGSIHPSLGISPGLADSTTATNDVLLRSMFQLIQVDDNQYAIHSSKHGNYALDVDADGTSLILRDVRSLNAYKAGTETTFVTFSVSANSSTWIANGRYQLNPTASNAEKTLRFKAMEWSDLSVSITGTAMVLSRAPGSSIQLYDAPIKLGIPADFNPDVIARVTNAEYFDIEASEGNRSNRVTKDIDPAYAEQVAAKGSDRGTLAAAQTMLDSIDAALAEQGSQTRYPHAFYLTFRQGLFERILQSSESVDGNLGDHTVPYVYFTNEVDASGNYHPFMIVSTHGVPDSLAILGDVPRPPGDGITGRYEQQNVTRSFYLENFLLKFPMRDYGEVETLTENDLSRSGSLAADVKETTFDHHNYASPGSSALAIDGVVIYPSYNNRLDFAQSAAELSVRGMHAGRGLGVHYHADAHSAAMVNAQADTGLGLYNEDDYDGRLHPPVIGMGFDGVAAYGVYLDGDTTSHGASVALDDFGGHEHQDYGYHYHAASSDQTSREHASYTLHELGPLGAWAGRINNVPEFQERTKRSQWLGNP